MYLNPIIQKPKAVADRVIARRFLFLVNSKGIRCKNTAFVQEAIKSILMRHQKSAGKTAELAQKISAPFLKVSFLVPQINFFINSLIYIK